MRNSIHYARVSASPRLQRALAMLSDYRPHTTRDININANVCAVNSAICELRHNGYTIETTDCGISPDGSHIYTYRLIKETNGALELAI